MQFNFWDDYVNNKITREYCRNLFWKSGLTYENAITNKNIDLLVKLLNDHISRYNLFNGHPYWECVNNCDESYKLIPQVFITGKGTYFRDREIISFNIEYDDNTNNPHWIGFCGDSDTNNSQPILRAFEEWVNKIKGNK